MAEYRYDFADIGQRMVFDVEPSKKGNIPVLKDVEQPPLQNMSYDQLKEVHRDVEDAVRHLEQNSKVSYVIVDNFGNVSRSRMRRQKERIALEIKRREADDIPYNPNRVVNFDLEDELEPETLADYSALDISCTTAMQEATMTNVFDPEFYRQQAAYNASVAEKLEGIPLHDIFEVGQVLTFQKTLGDKEFNFAAIKIDTGWAMTGDRNGGYKTWQTLLEFIGVQALDTVAVMVTTPENSLKKYAESKRKAKEIQASQSEQDAAKAKKYAGGTLVE